MSRIPHDRRPTAHDTFQPAPLDGVGSPRWVSPQVSRETMPPPVAPVAPMPSFRSEEAVVREDSLANHWGCTVLVGSVKNSWQPVDHQMWGHKIHSDASDPFSQNPIFRPAGGGGARSIPREMVWLTSRNYRYTGIENDLVRHVPDEAPQYEYGGRDARPGLNLVGQQSMLTPRSSASARTGVNGSSRGSQSCRVVLPRLGAEHGNGGPEQAAERPGQRQLSDDVWIAAVLELHNRARALHGAPPLVWSDECFELAKAQASQCALSDLATHGHLDGRSGRHGQNICVLPAAASAAARAGLSDGNGESGDEGDELVKVAQEAVETWYEEVEDYQWEEPGFAGNTGHFSQLVWGDTEAVGMAVVVTPAQGSERAAAASANGQADRRYIVANYYPAGNVYVPGEFERNVLPGPGNPNAETLVQQEFSRLAHLTPRAIPPRKEDTVDGYLMEQQRQHSPQH
jgi:hypothetical protein